MSDRDNSAENEVDLHASIHKTLQEGYNDHMQQFAGPALLIGWVIVAEFQAADGKRWLQRTAGTGSNGQGPMPSWQVRGYLHDVLADDSWSDTEAHVHEDEDEDAGE